jgi:hypothetical protein
VYWVRRLLVLATAFALVFGIGRLLSGGSDATSGEDAAAQVAADSSASFTPSLTDPTTPSWTADSGGTQTRTADPSPTLAAPEGECSGTDIAVTPKIEDAVAGRDVTIVLQLRTLESEACTWRTGRAALAVTITSGKDDIWSSRQCPRVIPVQDVVVRNAVTTDVGVTWNAKRSDDECSKLTPWAMPGWYHVTAAALGGEPSDLQFELVRPTAATVTKTASPTQSPSGRPLTTRGPSGSAEPD